MLAKKNEQDLTEAIRGPVGMFGIAIAIIAISIAAAGTFAPADTGAPAKTVLFGSFISDAINELIYYLRWGSYIAIVAGGLMIAVTLSVSNTKIKQ